MNTACFIALMDTTWASEAKSFCTNKAPSDWDADDQYQAAVSISCRGLPRISW